MKNKVITLPVLLWALLSGNAWAAIVNVNDNDYNIYDPNDTYIYDVVVGGSEIFTAGFGFTDPSHAIIVDINVPSNLIGTLEFAITSGPDATGIGYVFDALVAGQSASYQFGGALNATVSNPIPVYISLRAAGMPPLTSDPSLVTQTVVPVPAAVWLFGSGLLGLIGVARRKKAA